MLNRIFKRAQASTEPSLDEYNARLAYMLQGMESSFGQDRRSADTGEMKWITGLTNPAINELKRVKLIENLDVNNRDQVLDASTKYFNYLRERNPQKSLADIYTDHYWNGWKKMKNPQQVRQRTIEKANSLLETYQPPALAKNTL